MNSFFSPRSIAVIGASVKKNKIGGILVRNLIDLKFKGKIYPVNPKYQKIGALKCYPNLAAVDSPVALAVIAIPAPLVPGLILECAVHHPPIKNIVIISAGFAESGPAGASLEDEISALAKKYSLSIIGPNCLGVINVKNKLNASFAPNNFLPGNVSLIMQSGALTTALLDLARDENLGFSKIATIGNKTVLNESAFLDYFARDNETGLIGMYLENIKHGPSFCRSLYQSTSKKPVIIIKSGIASKAKRAVTSHTGAMAGDELIAATAIIDNGGIYSDDLSAFISTAKLISRFKKPLNNQIVILTNAGGPAVMATDLIEKNKILKLYEFTAAEHSALKKLLPPAASVNNPIDILGDARSPRYDKIIQSLRKNKKIGAVIVLVTLQAQTDVKGITDVLIKANRQNRLPFIPVIISHESNNVIDRKFNGAGLANFLYPSEAIIALSNYCSAFYHRPPKSITPLPRPINKLPASLALLLNNLKKENRTTLSYAESCHLTKRFGLHPLPAKNFTAANLKNLSYPVALKIDDPRVLHKNKKGGLALNLMNRAELLRAKNKLNKKFAAANLIIQPQVAPGVEIILGLKADPVFGPVLLFGLGGITTELINEKLLWLLPVNESAIRQKLVNSRLLKFLIAQKIKPAAVIHEIKKLAALSADNPWLAELDLNPIIFYPNQKPVIVDIKIIAKNNYQ